MNSLKHTIFSAALVIISAGAALAAVNPNTGMPVESKQQIADRCGIELTSPNAIADAAGASCNVVGVLALLQPKDEPANNE